MAGIVRKIISKFNYKVMDKTKFIAVPRVSIDKIKTLIEKLRPLDIGIDLIRLGPKGDGGYLLPNDLYEIEACFSPGVDKISDFEADCHKQGMKIFLADKSVDKPNLKIERYSFLKKYIGTTNDDDFITMDQWINESGVVRESDLLLQMDIEGSEYISILNTSDNLMKRFRIIVIEFHSLEKLWNPEFYNIANETFSKLLKTHTCVHIHPNNFLGIDKQFGIEIPRLAEFTFIRKDRVKNKKKQIRIPHPLDFDNTDKEHISLPEIWWKHNVFK